MITSSNVIRTVYKTVSNYGITVVVQHLEQHIRSYKTWRLIEVLRVQDV